MKTTMIFLILLFSLFASALKPSPVLQQRFFDSDGAPLAGGKVYCYVAGTTTQTDCYTNASGTVAANPVILDSDGYAPIWIGSGSYKFAVYDSADVLQFTVDNVDGGPALPNGALVFAYRDSSDQAIAADTNTTILFNTESLDDGNQYDPTTGTFTASQDMRVYVHYNVSTTQGGTAAAAMVIALYLNDTLTGNCYTFVNSNLLVNSQTDIWDTGCFIDLEEDDELEIIINAGTNGVDVDYNSLAKEVTSLAIYELASEIPTGNRGGVER